MGVPICASSTSRPVSLAPSWTTRNTSRGSGTVSAHAPRPPSTAQTEQFLQSLEGIAALPDVRALVPMLIVRQGVSGA